MSEDDKVNVFDKDDDGQLVCPTCLQPLEIEKSEEVSIKGEDQTVSVCARCGDIFAWDEAEGQCCSVSPARLVRNYGLSFEKFEALTRAQATIIARNFNRMRPIPRA